MWLIKRVELFAIGKWSRAIYNVETGTNCIEKLEPPQWTLWQSFEVLEKWHSPDDRFFTD